MVNKIIKKKEILFFTTTSSVDTLFNQMETTIRDICNNFQDVFIVCCDNLVEQKKVKKYSNKKFPNLSKKIKFFVPIDFDSLDIFFKNKNPIIINDNGRVFKFYRLLFYLKRKNIPIIEISNVGNVQGGIGDYKYTNKIVYLKLFLTKLLPQKMCAVLCSLGIFPKVDIRFTSNRALYNSVVKNQKRFIRLPSIYRKFVLVRSKHFDENFYNNKKKLSDDIILLIDLDVGLLKIAYQLSSKFKDETGKLASNLVNEHNKKLNDLLDNLSKTFKKKVVISIHPAYNLNKTIQRFKGKYQVIKFKTKDLIRKSFLVLFFDSSSIIDAIIFKKKIISLRSDLFREKGKKYSSELYTDRINLKIINLFDKININGKLLVRDLNSRLKYYDKYLNKYACANLKTSSNKKIIKIIKSKYF